MKNLTDKLSVQDALILAENVENWKSLPDPSHSIVLHPVFAPSTYVGSAGEIGIRIEKESKDGFGKTKYFIEVYYKNQQLRVYTSKEFPLLKRALNPIFAKAKKECDKNKEGAANYIKGYLKDIKTRG